MQILAFIFYVLVAALAGVFLLWAGDWLLAVLRKRKRRRRPAVQPVGGETQYTMFTQLPNGEDAEFDPLAEAEIYLIYGNRQMAIDTLTKAAESHPEREDIRNRLAELNNSNPA
jgi:hypothetical protein